MEQMKAELNTWTPERVKELVNNEAFKAAAQQVVQYEKPADMPEDEWSNMSESDKIQIKTLTQKIENMELVGKQEKYQAILDKQNMELSTKYTNYDTDKIMTLRKGMEQGQVQATNEHVYKAFYHDENVTRAYKQGMADAQSGNREKIEGSSFSADTSSTVPADDKPERQEGETGKNYLMRIFQHNLNKKKTK
jgi:hypothetical protein